MQHTIPLENLGAMGAFMANAVEKCVHCGFCLPTCPTYAVLREEMDSPRGRIILMKSVLEGDLELEQALPYIDRCLGCLSCVTACPSGVPYGELLSPFRAYAQGQRQRPWIDRSARRITLETLPRPGRFRLAASMGNASRLLHKALPESYRAMLSLLPERLPPTSPLPSTYPAQGQRRARVALLTGCVQQVLWPEINWATLRVLARNGVEVVIPPEQGCCGALALHTGEMDLARQQALHNLKIFPADVDAILTNAAGCGSGLHEYPLLFQGTEGQEQAEEFAARVLDVSVFLDDLGIIPPLHPPETLHIAYHDACHLAHAQGVTAEPRRLLNAIPGVTIVPIEEAEICCGSAGTYNLEQPETASLLGERKVKHILATGAQVVVSGNIGCLVQLRTQLSRIQNPLPVWHTIELIDHAYRDWPPG